ncbi:glutamine synthetase [Corynebacterium sp. sy017]|uniref:glutamine synthetase family protein n=1 Tax=unclassified Corynebacterium TaxID=2624378 RepID=UPI001185C30F|nr:MULTISPECIES: glutamine synthetase family protein [unclassified Corynebacterium]MBP3087908.1 glutamine synthetase [Corynebacterium sp. sy017]TSD92449.1 glutamine synthetase [Corynebacterium sp. SY003]
MEATSNTTELLFVATSDISARAKGRAMLMSDYSPKSSLGWVPANLGIGALGHIAPGSAFGSSGDLRLRPDPTSLSTIKTPMHTVNIVLADLVEPDGKEWSSCMRTFLKRAVNDLADYGLRATVAFEHEFMDTSQSTEHHPFSLRDFRRAEPIGTQLMNIAKEAGLEPETWLPEYGKHQFEMTLRPADPVTAADRAIVLRELIHDVFEQAERNVSFSPLVSPDSVGNGVHVHFGLTDLMGKPVCFDPAQPGRLSKKAAQFAAGIIKYAPAFSALCAPLTISYKRLVPNNWSTARVYLGLNNREALLRIPSTNELYGRDPAPQLHFEYRASDIGANPWLLIGSILRAGMQGLHEQLPPEPVIEGELDLDGEHKDFAQLPHSLPAALTELSENEIVKSWFSQEFLSTFLAIKRDECEALQGLSLAQQCEVYSRVY